VNLQRASKCVIYPDKYPNFAKKSNLSYQYFNKECQIILNHEVTKFERLGEFLPQILTLNLSPKHRCTNSLADESREINLICFSKIIVLYHIKLSKKLNYIPLMKFFSYTWPYADLRLIRAGDVEPNPGPMVQGTGSSPSASTEFRIITYNARGLKDKLKLKRILNSCHNILRDCPNSFILIQETHLDREGCDQLKLLWRHGWFASPGVGRQAGTLTLFNNAWEITKTTKDEFGRINIINVTKTGQRFCICNLYAPNDHDIHHRAKCFIGTYR